jgi:hypothetical protein
MKRIAFLVLTAAPAAGLIASTALTAGRTDDGVSPIFGVKIPAGCTLVFMRGSVGLGAPLSPKGEFGRPPRKNKKAGRLCPADKSQMVAGVRFELTTFGL